SIKDSYAQYRALGARARAMLVAAAAERWKADPASLRVERGVVFGPGRQRAPFGELAEAAMKQPVPDKVTLKDPKDFRLIGAPTTLLASPAKSSGRQQYAIDVRLPGMLTAVILRPPVFGARIQSLDVAAAKAMRGVKKVFPVPLDRGAQGVAVVADGFWAARQARDAVKVQWDTGAVQKADTEQQLAQYRALAGTPGKLKYDADISKIAQAPKTIEAEYVFPYLAHAAMEPISCTVRLGADRCEIWSPSQMPGLDAANIAKATGLKYEQVQMHVQMAGGGFGRRAVPSSEYHLDAVAVARGLRSAGVDAPVKVMWTREDDMAAGYYRPFHLHRARIGFDEQGNILGWDHTVVGQSILAGSPFESFMVKDGIDATIVEGMKTPYDIPMRLAVHHPVVNVPVLWWRSVGSTHTAYVMQTLIDEVARASGQDPVDYQRRLIGNRSPRHLAALDLAVQRSGYGQPLPEGRAWGVALHESFDSVVAYIVQASLADGKPRLHKVTAAVHCNLCVNPRAVEAQVQGAALMALGTTLPGAAITLKDGVVQQTNFNAYTVARMPDMPEVQVHIVASAEPPTGMGEPGVPPLAPAFANAIARLTGKTPRTLPFNLAA
ncbi:MAG: molybdopterin-dependent oxidoreductase, partial [Betaproteobacteria bacterium]|nr:molybdopterin-dependent oxidoreductase [Betaproteobacteria bacterium]